MIEEQVNRLVREILGGAEEIAIGAVRDAFAAKRSANGARRPAERSPSGGRRSASEIGQHVLDPALLGLALYSYDDLDRITETRTLHFVDDDTGRRQLLGRVSGFDVVRNVYDDLTREVTTLDASEQETRIESDLLGRVIEATLGSGALSVHRRYEETDVGVRETRAPAHTPSGELTTILEYGAHGLLTSARGSEGTWLGSQTIDAEGRVTRFSSPEETRQVLFDPFGQPTDVLREGQDGTLERFLHWTYNGLGQPVEISSASGTLMGAHYDALSRLERQIEGDVATTALPSFELGLLRVGARRRPDGDRHSATHRGSGHGGRGHSGLNRRGGSRPPDRWDEPPGERSRHRTRRERRPRAGRGSDQPRGRRCNRPQRSPVEYAAGGEPALDRSDDSTLNCSGRGVERAR